MNMPSSAPSETARAARTASRANLFVTTSS